MNDLLESMLNIAPSKLLDKVEKKQYISEKGTLNTDEDFIMLKALAYILENKTKHPTIIMGSLIRNYGRGVITTLITTMTKGDENGKENKKNN